MFIHGRNLIIKADGVAIAAARSCDLTVDAEMIPVSSSSDGEWDHNVAGRKSWSLITNHLLYTPVGTDGVIRALAKAHDGIVQADSILDCNGTIYKVSSRGLTVFRINTSTYEVDDYVTYDTYGDEDTECANLIEDLENDTELDSYIFVIMSRDAMGMTSNLKTFLQTTFNVDMSNVPTGANRESFVLIGKTDSTGIVAFCPITSSTAAAPAKAQVYLAAGSFANGTPLSDAIAKVGTTLTAEIQNDGFTQDKLSGSMICKQCKVTGTLGNLAQGSFQFVGTGALS